MSKLLENYDQMVSRVETLCQGILNLLSDRITCRAGCSSCCTSITIFPVEAAALNAALAELPEDRQDAIRRHVREHADGERCPLLEEHHCLLYSARPIICRTHGLPIIYNDGDQRSVDCCPLNLTDAEVPLSGAAVIDLDRLNSLLVAVNALYLSHADAPHHPERLSIAQALKEKP